MSVSPSETRPVSTVDEPSQTDATARLDPATDAPVTDAPLTDSTMTDAAPLQKSETADKAAQKPTTPPKQAPKPETDPAADDAGEAVDAGEADAADAAFGEADNDAASGNMAAAGNETDADTSDDFIEMTVEEWLDGIEDIAETRGYFEPLGKNHSVMFTDQGPTLLVTFESIEQIMERSDEGLPHGFALSDQHGWSQLCLLAHDGGWYRDKAVYRYFDRLVDDGFFEDFDRVVFYGAGAAGYAAAAYSVVAPGAEVLLVTPQATLDASITGWDKRHLAARRLSFDDRYGYGPDMIDAAQTAYVIYDPSETMDAMHAALFTRDNVVKLPLRHFGDQIENDLISMGLLDNFITAMMEGRFDRASFWKAMRGRRQYASYLRRVMRHLADTERHALQVTWCSAVLRSIQGPNIRRMLANAQANLEAQKAAAADAAELNALRAGAKAAADDPTIEVV